ncbi:MAG: Ig-like domain-containing protein [Gemmatimonadota bacterium]|nr:MAG: Ig-like domain-containing protein [Gemmatimonadota bacterium]
MSRKHVLACLGIISALSWTCSDSTEPPRPTSISLSATQIDLDALGATEQLTGQVLDQNGQPLPEEPVVWASSQPQVAPVSATGLVTAVSNGSAEITASSGTLSATATANVAQVVAVLQKFAGDAQSGTVGQALPAALEVRALDRLDKPVGGATIGFSVVSGGGSVDPTTATTNGQGRATTAWTLGTAAGSQQVDASQADVATPTSFTATAGAAAATAVQKVQGEGQTGPSATPLADSIVVRVVDVFDNPVTGRTVAFAATAGGGSVSPGSVVADADGLAATEWTLGSALGDNALTATVSGLAPASFAATSVLGPPANFTKEAGDNQLAMVGTDVPTAPTVEVTDAGGNPIAAVQVTFSVAAGSGSITGAVATTDGAGLAAVGSWTLGPDPGLNELTASVDGLTPLTFTATGTTGVPAANIVKEAGDGQSSEVGTAVTTPPTVMLTDAADNPVAGQEVFFEVASGGGSITGATAVSDADGLAAVGSWTLGTTAGANTLTATTQALAPVTFTATGTPGPPASLQVNDGDGQTGLVGFGVNIPPSVLVSDQYGNPVAPGVTATFTVTGGGGSLTDATPTTDEGGVATVGKWTLGPAPATNTLDATVAGAGTVGFTATGVTAAYDIDIRFLSSVTPSQEQTFLDAAARWEELLYGELSNVTLNLPPRACGSNSPPLNETVDDLLILATIEFIDGPGGILGQAGPCRIRSSDNLTVLGLMRFDEADVANLEAGGQFDEVIRHEMGHVIGFGVLWDLFGLLTGAGGSDPYFTGARAVEAFDRIGGADYTGNKVPVENVGGPGTADAHWRESIFRNELMTGFLNGGPNPLSELTVASLWDIGYVVNLDGADGYSVNLAPGALVGPVTVRLINDVISGPIYVIDDGGRVLRVIEGR